MKGTAFVVGAIASLSMGSVALAQNGSTFCSEPYYGGTCTSPQIPPGSYTLTQLSSYGFYNDWAQSFAAPSGGTGQLFEHDTFGGSHWEIAQNYGGQNLSLVGASGVVSSAKIRTGITFFENANYEGSATSVVGPQVGTTPPNYLACYTLAQLQAFGFVNDWASSVMIPSNWAVDLYSNDYWSGTKWTLTQMDSNSANFTNFGGNDAVSSVCVRYAP